MKLFGKKDSGAQQPDNSDLGEEQFDAPDAGAEGLGDLEAPPGEEPAPKTLSAPTRSMSSSGGGGRKGLLVLLLLIVVAGMGGGYFYLMGDSEDYSKPVHVTAKTPAVPTADKPKAPPQPPPAAASASTPATTTAEADPFAATPPQPAAPAPAAAANVDPFAPAPPPAPAASNDPFAMPSPDAAGLGKPPGDEASAITPSPVAAGAPPVAAAPDELAPDMPPPDLVSAPQTPGGPAPASAAATPAPAPAGEDLPLPADAGLEPAPGAAAPAPTPNAAATTDPAAAAKPPETAPSWAAPGTAAVPGTSNPATKPTSPSDAELAIVQNSAVLDQLSAPVATAKPAPPGAAPAPAATGMPFDPNAPKPGANEMLKQLQQNLETQAIRRKITSGYMIIRKESDAEDIDSRLTAARTALAQGRSPAALELFEDLRKDFPKDKRILMGRAVSLQKLGQDEEALAAYEQVLNRDPKNLDALSNMLGLLKSKDPALAVEKLQELRDTYPYQGDITAQLGIAYAANGQYDEGLKYLEMADSLKPGSSYVLYNKAVLLDKMGKRQDAATLYRRILRLAADGELDQQLPLDTIRSRLSVLR